jgi:hypothetical protein
MRLTDFLRLPLMAKLAHVQSQLDARALGPKDAVALLHVIHAELGHPQGKDCATYERYAALIESLKAQMPEVYAQIDGASPGRRAMSMIAILPGGPYENISEPAKPERRDVEPEGV